MAMPCELQLNEPVLEASILLALPADLLISNVLSFLPTIPTLLRLRLTCRALLRLIQSSPAVHRHVDLTEVPRRYGKNLAYLILLGGDSPAVTASLRRLIPGKPCEFTYVETLTLPDLNLVLDPPLIGPRSLRRLKCRSYAMTSWESIEVLLQGLPGLVQLDLALQVGSGPIHMDWLSRPWEFLSLRLRIYPGWVVSYSDLADSVVQAVLSSRRSLRDFRFYARCNDKELGRMVSALRKCEFLVYIGLSGIRSGETGLILCSLGEVAHLQGLTLDGSCEVDREILRSFAHSRLRYLNMKGIKKIELDELAVRSQLTSSLEVLKLPAIKGRHLTDLLNLVESCINLRRLEVTTTTSTDENVCLAILLLNSFPRCYRRESALRMDPDVTVTQEKFESAKNESLRDGWSCNTWVERSIWPI
ncbi:hypothetical protein FOL46_008761 [Perkinsus olseni]|uniref:F-box domain-containing protein n=1 Tax=Perkinsus olseni TaxID=32597 RepID=A0A7J6L569_PEROL|nr:hypothetical protein FOL46_008761 [Perkinsus olseni]